MRYQKNIIPLMLAVVFTTAGAARQQLNFNGGWDLHIGDIEAAPSGGAWEEALWQPVTLPYAFNGDEAFRKDITELTDTVCWYRKKFRVESGELRVQN